MNRRQHSRTRQKNGSVIILVVIVLVLITILLTTYLHVIRTRNWVNIEYNLNTNYAINTLETLILQQIEEDYPFGEELSNPHEPFDYPSLLATDINRTYVKSYPVGEAVDSNGYPFFTVGNARFDDDYLASSTPENNRWGKLSNITGNFLDYTNSNFTYIDRHPTTDELVPGELSRGSNITHVNVNINDPRLIDCDGDGIGDSLLAYVPGSETQGVRYLFAARVIDLSSRININTAALIRDGQPQSSLGLSPADINIEYLLSQSELNNLAYERGLGLPTFDNTLTPFEKLTYYFGRATSATNAHGLPLTEDLSNDGSGSPVRFSPDDEQIELAYLNGINNFNDKSFLEETLPFLLRRDTQEYSYEDLSASQSDYFRNNGRLQLTTISGGVHDFLPGEPRGYWAWNRGMCPYNVQYLNTGDTNAVAGIKNCLFRLISGDSGNLAIPTWNSLYDSGKHFERYASMGFTSDEAGMSMSACLIDATDTDNRITVTDTPPGNFYAGFEHLPIITECYTQRKCNSRNMATSQNGNTYEIGNIRSSNIQSGYAVEIANPYHFPIKLTNLYLAAGKNSPNSALLGTPLLLGDINSQIRTSAYAYYDSEGDPVLPSGHKLLLWANYTTGTPATAEDNIYANWITPAITASAGTAHALQLAPLPSDAIDPGNYQPHDYSQIFLIANVENQNDQLFNPASFINTGKVVSSIPICNASRRFSMRVDDSWHTLDGNYTALEVAAAYQAGIWQTSRNQHESEYRIGYLQTVTRNYGLDAGLNALLVRNGLFYDWESPNILGSTSNIISNNSLDGRRIDDEIQYGSTKSLARQQGDHDIFIFAPGSYITYQTLHDAGYVSLGEDQKRPYDTVTRADISEDRFYAVNEHGEWQGNTWVYTTEGYLPSDDLLMRVPLISTTVSDETRLLAPTAGPDMRLNDTPGDLYFPNGTPGQALDFLLHQSNGTPRANGTYELQGLNAVRFPLDTPYTRTTAPSYTTEIINHWLDQGAAWRLSQSLGGISTANDGFDQNNNGVVAVDGSERLFKFGTLNLNTASESTLMNALPIVDPSLRQAIVSEIIAQRTAGLNGPNLTGGIDFVNRLYEPLATVPEVIAFADRNNSFDIDQLDELLAVAPMLSNVTTTRSDYFLAYIVVQAFPANDFSQGALETRRMILVISRATGTATILGRYEYE